MSIYTNLLEEGLAGQAKHVPQTGRKCVSVAAALRAEQGSFEPSMLASKDCVSQRVSQRVAERASGSQNVSHREPWKAS